MPRHIRVAATLLIAIATAALLTWQQLHDGVPAHSFLARDDMPSISNWWGLLTLPLLTWFALGNTERRVAAGRTTAPAALAGFVGAAMFGAILAITYTLGYADVPRIQVRVLPLIAIALPIYRAEYLLGFVVALSYTFGGVLPLVIGSVFASVGAALHLAPRWLLRRFRVKR